MYDLPTYINIAYILHMYVCMCVYRFNQLPPRVCVFSQLLTALSPSIPLFWFLSQREYANYGPQGARILSWPAGSKQLLSHQQHQYYVNAPDESGCGVTISQS